MNTDKITNGRLPNGDISVPLKSFEKELKAVITKGTETGLTLQDKARFIAVAKEFTEFTEVDIEDGIAFDTIDDCEINLGNNVTISVVVYDRHCSDEERAEKYPHTISEFEDAVIDACVEARIRRAVK